MPSGPRPSARPGAGPGRGPRARSTGRRPSPVREPPAEQLPAAEPSPTGRAETAARRRSSITSRALALAVVVLVLTISYATSLRIYFAQSAEIAATRAEISQRQRSIVDLQSDLARWQDPAYVSNQARARLGWVLPGETGFKVVGESGQPLDGDAEVAAQAPAAPTDAWWEKLWGSVEAADTPAPAQPRPTKQPTITEDTKPGSLPTPR